MAKNPKSDTEGLREILIDAIEVELATLKATVSFWKQWIELASGYLRTTAANLSAIRDSDSKPGQLLLEAIDTSRETARRMTDLPKKAAEDFLRELDALEQRKARPQRPAPKRRARAKP